MAWVYVQGSGNLYRPDGTLVGRGYAGGNGGLSPEGVNSPEHQMQRNIGPIPVGLYKKGKVLLTSNLGPFAIPLIPHAGNQMFGRSGFYCHGDKAHPPRSASHGCIIQARAVRTEFYESNDPDLMVVNIRRHNADEVLGMG